MLLWRNRNRVYYRAIDADERELLAALSHGSTFGEICEMIAGGAEQEDPTIAINRRLETWLRDALLIRG